MPYALFWTCSCLKEALQIHNSEAGSGKDMDLTAPDPTAECSAAFASVELILVEVFGF